MGLSFVGSEVAARKGPRLDGSGRGRRRRDGQPRGLVVAIVLCQLNLEAPVNIAAGIGLVFRLLHSDVLAVATERVLIVALHMQVAASHGRRGR